MAVVIEFCNNSMSLVSIQNKNKKAKCNGVSSFCKKNKYLKCIFMYTIFFEETVLFYRLKRSTKK